MVNRKLVRPNLAELKEKFNAPVRTAPTPNGMSSAPPMAGAPAPSPAPPVRDNPGGPPGRHDHGARRRPVPPDSTSAEAFYYVKQMNARTPMVVVLDSGEQLRGHIEWYDRNCIKVNREGAPNLLVFKHAIKYVYKQEEEGGASEAPHAEA
jgi:RNA chaperone Hfq